MKNYFARFSVLASTLVTDATGVANPPLAPAGPAVMLGDPIASDAPVAVVNPGLMLWDERTLAIAGADACTGQSLHLPIAECSAWQDMYNGTGGTDSGVLNATVGVIEQCALD